MPFTTIAHRNVLDTATVVTGENENEVVYEFELFRFRIEFREDSGAMRVEGGSTGPSSADVIFVNADNSLGFAYSVPNIGTSNGKPIHFSLHAETVIGTSKTRIITVTLSA